MKNKKIAVIGSGISGISMAYMAQHNGVEVVLFEKNNYFGGHANTIDIEIDKKSYAVDTGFLVHNKLTYPNLIQFFDLLGTDIVDSEMTLSIKVEDLNLEWGGSNLDTVFAQRKNLFSPKFYHFLLEILDFNKKAEKMLDWAKGDINLTLGDLINHYGYSAKVKEWYLIPMAAAIWSTPADKILDFPAYTFLTFSLNHKLLQVNDRPVWRTIKNGSRNYVQKALSNIQDKRLNATVTKIERRKDRTVVFSIQNGESREDEFDVVVLSSHAGESANMLSSEMQKAKKILSAIKTEKNIAYVHSDENFLPKTKKIWSAWNYVSSPNSKKVSVSYLISKLQPISSPVPVIVTLNPHREVDPEKTYRVIEYYHPLFDAAAIRAQKDLDEVQGDHGCYFAGAWTGYGFHEDGIKSAVRIASKLGLEIPWKAVL